MKINLLLLIHKFTRSKINVSFVIFFYSFNKIINR